MDNQILLAADLGTTQLMLMAAERMPDGRLRVLATEKTNTPEDSIQNGIIIKPSNITACLIDMVRKMENVLRNRDGRVYDVKGYRIGVTGRSLRTVRGTVQRSFSSAIEVSRHELASLGREIEQRREADKKPYALFNEEYRIDGEFVRDAEGVVCSEIEANYLVAYGRKDIGEKLDKMIERTGHHVNASMLAVVAIADAVLSEEDKNLGCAMVNFGASTTSVVLYKDGFIRHVAVVPFGAKHITNDLATLGLDNQSAEAIKLKVGSPLKPGEEKNIIVKLRPDQEVKVPLHDIYKAVYARIDEIVDMVMTEISHYGFENQLQSGMIITGGGAKLHDIVPFLEDKCKMQVRRGSHVHMLDDESQAEYSDTIYSQLIGLLYNIDEECVEVRDHQAVAIDDLKKEEEKKNDGMAGSAASKGQERRGAPVQKGRRLGAFFGTLGNLFDQDTTIEDK